MKKFIFLYVFIILSLASCNANPMPTQTDIPKPSSTPLPTITPTTTPCPTATPRPELTADVVGLPWDTNSISPDIPAVIYKPCYVNTANRWHAGDVFLWRLKSGQIIDMVSPVEGKVVYMVENWRWNNTDTGGNIFVQTPYVLDGKTVYYQLCHSSTFDDNIHVGVTVTKGQHIGTLRWDGTKDPGGYSILDFMLLSGDFRLDKDTEAGRNQFFDTAPYHLDDLALIPHSEVPRCEGNPR